MTLKAGDVIKSSFSGEELEVIDVSKDGKVAFLSDGRGSVDTLAVEEISNSGWKKKKTKFVPVYGSKFWYMNIFNSSTTPVFEITFSHGVQWQEVCVQIRNCFETKEEAAEAYQKIIKLLKEVN